MDRPQRLDEAYLALRLLVREVLGFCHGLGVRGGDLFLRPPTRLGELLKSEALVVGSVVPGEGRTRRLLLEDLLVPDVILQLGLGLRYDLLGGPRPAIGGSRIAGLFPRSQPVGEHRLVHRVGLCTRSRAACVLVAPVAAVRPVGALLVIPNRRLGSPRPCPRAWCLRQWRRAVAGAEVDVGGPALLRLQKGRMNGAHPEGACHALLPLPGRRDDHAPLGWRHCMLALGAEGAVDEGGELLSVSPALRSPIHVEDLNPVDELHLADGTVGDRDLNSVDELETAHATVDEGLELGHGSCAALAQILLTGGGRLCPKLIVDVTLGVRVDGGLTVGSNCLPGRAPIVLHEVPHAAG